MCNPYYFTSLCYVRCCPCTAFRKSCSPQPHNAHRRLHRFIYWICCRYRYLWYQKEDWRAIKESLGQYSHEESCWFPAFYIESYATTRLGLTGKGRHVVVYSVAVYLATWTSRSGQTHPQCDKRATRQRSILAPSKLNLLPLSSTMIKYLRQI